MRMFANFHLFIFNSKEFVKKIYSHNYNVKFHLPKLTRMF